MSQDSKLKGIDMLKMMAALAVVSLFYGCASYLMESADLETQLAANEEFVKAGDHNRIGRYSEAGKAIERALDVRTKGGKLANGRDMRYDDVANLHSYAASYFLKAGDISSAAFHWKKSFNEMIQGNINAAATYNEADRINNSMLSIVAGLVGAYAAIRAPDQSSAEQMLGLTSEAIKSWDKAQKADAISPSKLPMPLDGVYRVPATVQVEPLNRIYRLRSPGSYCTAFAVSKFVFLTNAHCVTTNKGSQVKRPGDLTLYSEQLLPGPKYLSGLNHVRKIAYFVTHAGVNGGYDGKFENDWAILVLDKNSIVGHPHPYPIIYDSFAADAAMVVTPGSTELMLGGYSSDLVSGQYMTLHWGCKASRVEAEIHSNCESEKGSSGSPVMLAKPPFTLLGINAGAYIHTDKSTGQKTETQVQVNIRQFVKPLQEVLARER